MDEFSAGFNADKLVLCDSGWVQFTDSLGTAINQLRTNWDFGDGTTSAFKNPRHYYARPGKYNVKLSVSAPSGCNNQVIKNTFITVAATPVVNISSSSDSCTSNIIKFAAESDSDTSIRTWQWQFGNGQQFAGQFPPLQTFTSAGNFQNQLNVTSNAGCIVSVNQPVNISSVFELIRTADTAICRNDKIQLSVSGLSSYNWQPAGGLSCTNCNNPVASPLTDSWYKISGPLIPTDCIVTDSIFIKVIQPYQLVAPENVVLCSPQSLQLQASGAPGYKWLPASAFDNPAIANPVARVDASVTINVIGYDTLGCFNDTATVKVIVSGRPNVELGPDVTISVGNTYQFSPVVSADVVTYRWTPSSGLSCTTCANPVLTVAGNENYSVKVANNYGCEAGDSINIFVTCNNSTLFIPNTFSPNGDGMNDYFFPRGKGVRSIDYLAVFNRWGQKVFERRNVVLNNVSNGWDGKVNGKTQESGVYTYFMKVVCDNSQVLNYSGNINLIQ